MTTIEAGPSSVALPPLLHFKRAEASASAWTLSINPRTVITQARLGLVGASPAAVADASLSIMRQYSTIAQVCNLGIAGAVQHAIPAAEWAAPTDLTTDSLFPQLPELYKCGGGGGGGGGGGAAAADADAVLPEGVTWVNLGPFLAPLAVGCLSNHPLVLHVHAEASGVVLAADTQYLYVDEEGEARSKVPRELMDATSLYRCADTPVWSLERCWGPPYGTTTLPLEARQDATDGTWTVAVSSLPVPGSCLLAALIFTTSPASVPVNSIALWCNLATDARAPLGVLTAGKEDLIHICPGVTMLNIAEAESLDAAGALIAHAPCGTPESRWRAWFRERQCLRGGRIERLKPTVTWASSATASPPPALTGVFAIVLNLLKTRNDTQGVALSG
jgi:hypothetical protein